MVISNVYRLADKYKRLSRRSWADGYTIGIGSKVKGGGHEGDMQIASLYEIGSYNGVVY